MYKVGQSRRCTDETFTILVLDCWVVLCYCTKFSNIPIAAIQIGKLKHFTIWYESQHESNKSMLCWSGSPKTAQMGSKLTYLVIIVGGNHSEHFYTMSCDCACSGYLVAVHAVSQGPILFSVYALLLMYFLRNQLCAFRKLGIEIWPHIVLTRSLPAVFLC